MNFETRHYNRAFTVLDKNCSFRNKCLLSKLLTFKMNILLLLNILFLSKVFFFLNLLSQGLGDSDDALNRSKLSVSDLSPWKKIFDAIHFFLWEETLFLRVRRMLSCGRRM